MTMTAMTLQEREQAQRHAQALAGDPGPALSIDDVFPQRITVRPVPIRYFQRYESEVGP